MTKQVRFQLCWGNVTHEIEETLLEVDRDDNLFWTNLELAGLCGDEETDSISGV
jgi:hypothetical protein